MVINPKLFLFSRYWKAKLKPVWMKLGWFVVVETRWHLIKILDHKTITPWYINSSIHDCFILLHYPTQRLESDLIMLQVNPLHVLPSRISSTFWLEMATRNSLMNQWILLIFNTFFGIQKRQNLLYNGKLRAKDVYIHREREAEKQSEIRIEDASTNQKYKKWINGKVKSC